MISDTIASPSPGLQRNLWHSLRAGLVHAILSLVFTGLLLLVLKNVWYPGGIFKAAGVMDFLVILVGVDVVLGPLFTAVVWAPGKKELKRDIFIIVLLQLAGLGYGLKVLAETRPVYYVATQDRIRLVTRADLTPEDAASLRPGLIPELRSAALPQDAQQRQKLLDSVLAGGKDIDLLPAYWRGYGEGKDELWERARDVKGLALNKDNRKRLEWAEWWQGIDLSSSRFVPMRVIRSDLAAVLHPTTHEPVAFLDVDPWGVLPLNPSRADPKNSEKTPPTVDVTPAND